MHCSNCDSRSEKTDPLSDLNLAVNNPLTKEKFSRMELSLLNTLRPETLDGDNCYFCSRCQAKFAAEKGVEYSGFPKLLLFNCNRFVFDLNTFQRVKVNDRFEFPVELDMSRFVGKYADVRRRLREEKPELFVQRPKEEPKRAPQRKKRRQRKDKIQEGFQNLHTSRKGKRFQNKKSSKLTKQFLRNRRKKFSKMKQSFNSAQDEIFFVEKGADAGNFKMISKVDEVQIYTSVKTGESQPERADCASQKICEMLENEQKLSNDKDSRKKTEDSRQSPAPKGDLKADEKGGPGSGRKTEDARPVGAENGESKSKSKLNPKIETGKEQMPNPGDTKEECKDTVQDELIALKKPLEANEAVRVEQPVELLAEPKVAKGGLPSQPTSPPSTPSHPAPLNEQISPDPLKSGSLPEEATHDKLKYQLYAIFIHKGTAYAGHYYIYIKSFESNLWYLFDDAQVTEVNLVNVLRDAVGGGCSHANAYMLAYRRVDSTQPSRPSLQEKVGTDKQLETINETMSLGHLESSNKKTESSHIGSKRGGGVTGDPLDLQQKMSFTDLAKAVETNKDIEEALMRKNPKMEEDLEKSAKMEGLVCPEYLKQIILDEMEQEERRNQMQLKKKQKQAKNLRLRVHFRLEVKTVAIRADRTFADFTQTVFERFGIKNREDCRLRLFNRIRDEMLDDFAGKENCSLEELKIFSTKNFIVEEKQEGAPFEAYDPLVGECRGESD